jgi:hypothetical protein
MKDQTATPQANEPGGTVSEAAEAFAKLADRPEENYAPMRDGSVREYDLPLTDPGRELVTTHPPESALARAGQALKAALNAPRPATAQDLAAQDFAAQLQEVQAAEAQNFGVTARAERHAANAKRHRRSAWMIRRHLNTQRRPSTPMAEPRPAHAAPRARDRRDRRTLEPQPRRPRRPRRTRAARI